MKRWAVGGTVLSMSHAELKGGVCRATERIFLAGDYLSSEPEWGYGTLDAVRSGRLAAATLRAYTPRRFAWA